MLMKKAIIYIGLFVALISCDSSTLTIENNSDKHVEYLIATERNFQQKDLVLGRELKGVEYSPRYGSLKAKSWEKIDSPFKRGQMSWAAGIDSICEDQAITFIFIPADDWIVPDLLLDSKWEDRREFTLTVRELDSLKWTIQYFE